MRTMTRFHRHRPLFELRKDEIVIQFLIKYLQTLESLCIGVYVCQRELDEKSLTFSSQKPRSIEKYILCLAKYYII